MADTDDLHDALALLADYHDHEDDDAQRCAYCRAVAVVGTAVPTLQAQVAAGAERYTRAVAGADAVRGRLVADLEAARATLSRVRASVIACAYCNGVGAQVCLPGDVIEACPACGGLRQAVDPEGTAARLGALAAKGGA